MYFKIESLSNSILPDKVSKQIEVGEKFLPPLFKILKLMNNLEATLAKYNELRPMSHWLTLIIPSIVTH